MSIIIAAYNEEKVIAQTIRRLLASTYEKFEIIVVADGSPDGMSAIVTKQFGNEPHVRLFTKPMAAKPWH